MLQSLDMGGNKEARFAEVEYMSFAHRLEVSIEDTLVSYGRDSLPMKTFDNQLRLRTARLETERETIKWEIWDGFVWTPGYATTYAQMKHEIDHWSEVLVGQARADYGWKHGIHSLRQDREAIRSQVIADLPQRMGALSARAKVRASKIG